MSKKQMQKRNEIKDQLRSFKQFLESYNESQGTQLKLRFENAGTLIDKFSEIQLEIESKSEGENIDTEERRAFENEFYETLAIAQTYLNIVNRSLITSTPQQTQNCNRSTIEPLIKLPALSLPTFAGNFSEWRNFKDTFGAIVHNNDSLANAQKFYYLRIALKGDALKAIEAIEVTDLNYELALDILKERYENTKVVVNNHIREIVDFPNLSKENGTQMRLLYDTVIRNVRCLKSLKLPTEAWSALLVFIVSRKLDKGTLREWETKKCHSDLPSFDELMEFLKHHCNVLESLQPEEPKARENKFSIHPKGSKSFLGVNATTISCLICKETHSVFSCKTFKEKSFGEKLNLVKQLKLCYNCLKPNHAVNTCNNKRSCQKCNKRHHTLMHREREEVDKVSDPEPVVNKVETKTVVAATSNRHAEQIVLATACVDISGPKKVSKCRVLLDCGSMSNFITENLCKTLGLEKQKINMIVSGIGNGTAYANHCVEVTIRSQFSRYEKKITCIVLDKITENLPIYTFESLIEVPNNLTLADPSYWESGSIDCLLGSNVFWEILAKEKIELGKGKPVLQNTKFGWIVAGSTGNLQPNNSETYVHCALQHQLENFWKLEEIETPRLTPDEVTCENLFTETTKRLTDGRFCVRIPFRENLRALGASRETAANRFAAVEKRLIKNDELRKEYVGFMREYENLGHMKRVNEIVTESELHYYLPHHAVLKESSTTTRCRVVFDGSCKTDSGLSLNDVQFTGPTVQNDLLSILLRFRKHRYVINADVRQMYRQIRIDREQINFQRILWREDPSHELKCYALNTITYGLSSSPFLATRCLKKLAIDNKETYPLASEAIENDFYIDDLLSGHANISEALCLKNDIIKILESAKLNLRKWASNEPSLLSQSELQENSLLKLFPGGDSLKNKTLGIWWNPGADLLEYEIDKTECKEITKRNVLSCISRLFDPYGLLQLVVFQAKLLMQELWREKIGWNEEVSPEIRERWVEFLTDLTNINQIKIPRYVLLSKAVKIEMIGFSDASERGYGACIYIKTTSSNGQCNTSLVCAKAKAALLKIISIPRLELCAALLLAKLKIIVENALKLDIANYYFWSDSKIVLCWLRADPSRWKTFVSNRVSEIQSLTCVDDWHHIDSANNIADIVSRGISAQQLINLDAWWRGPQFIQREIEYDFENEKVDYSLEIPEAKNISITALANSRELCSFEKFSSLDKLIKVTAYCFRWLQNSRNKSNKFVGNLSIDEKRNTLFKLLKLAQRQALKQEFKELITSQHVKNTNRLSSLNPFIDKENLIRVGGRIQNSDAPYNVKHPIILPEKHRLTELIATNIHIEQLHCGPQALLFTLRETYWPINGRNLARKICHQCVICFKARPKHIVPPMGDLPSQRLMPRLPFEICGIDYCGYFLLKDKKGRGCKTVKVYVCVFVCFVTKAIHLEVVSSLSTDAFIAALRRFVARRGSPREIWSDNATNFVGAQRELAEIHRFVNSQDIKSQIQSFAWSHQIEWRTIPPRSPHMGGLWEASVKSFKYHLKRIAVNAHLVYEDFSTLVVQIEAVLNSRPLQLLTSDPTDLNPLTPGHFLIGRPITSVIDYDYNDCNPNRLVNYQRIQQLVQHLWRRWSREHLATLQQRHKGKSCDTTIHPGDMVILREDNVPPCNWTLARIQQVHPGPDGVVSVKTKNGVFKRPVIKVCPLPIKPEE